MLVPFLKQEVNHTNKLLTYNSRLSFAKRSAHRRLYMGMLHYPPCVTDGHNLLAKMLGLKITVSQMSTHHQRTSKDFQGIWSYNAIQESQLHNSKPFQTDTQSSQSCSLIDFLPSGGGGRGL